MVIKKIRNLLLSFLTLSLVTGCSLQRFNYTSKNNDPGNREDNTSLQTEFDPSIEDDDVQVVEDATEGVELPHKLSLGSVTYEENTSKSVSATVTVDKDFILEAADASGALWTLTIPANAVPVGTKIKMTPLQDIQSEDFAGEMKGGMKFEPDGLEFDKPGTLSIKLPSGTSESVMLSGDNEGGSINFMDGQPSEGTISSTMEHFSSAYFSTVESLDIQRLQNIIEPQFTAFIKEMKAFLKTPVRIGPIQDIPFECLSDKRYTQARIYALILLEPELSYGVELIKLSRSMTVLGSERAMEDFHHYGNALGLRFAKKASRILKESNNDPKKFLVASIAILSCYRNATLLDTKNQYPTIEPIMPYAHKTLEHLKDELREKHNYKLLKAIFELKRIIALGGESVNLDDIKKLMTFKLSYESECKDGTNSYRISGQIDLKFGEVNSDWDLTGTGTGRYESYEDYGPDPVKYLGPNTFKVNAHIDLNPCEDKAFIYIDKFGSDQESFEVTLPDGETYIDKYDRAKNSEDPTAHDDFAFYFKDKEDSKTACFKFECSMKNLTAVSVDQEFSEDDGWGGTAKIHFKLEHTVE